MNWSDERAAIETRLADNFDSLPVQYAGIPQSPPASGWVRVTIQNSAVERIALGPNGTLRVIGLIVFGIFMPAQQGSDPARKIVDEIDDIFREAEFSYQSSGLILCRQPRIDERGTTQDGAWYQVNLTVDYQRDVALT